MPRAKKKNVIRLAQAGLGGRGYGTMEYIIDTFENVEVVAVCDPYEDRVERALNTCKSKRPNTEVKGYTDYKEMVEDKNIDAVLVTTSWNAHVQVAVAAMNAGKFAGIECGGACSIDDCWQLVRTYERTGKWCMFMENCCYGQHELTLLRMIKDGRFGEMIHVEGGYQHDLRDEITHGHTNRHYRYDNYANRCGDFYPQHGLGPMQKYLSINRGNRMVTLSSMASKARGLHEFVVAEKGPDCEDAKVVWTEGDVVQTMIKCAHGETMLLTHDTSLPRPYSRGGKVQGTNGIWTEEGDRIYLQNKSANHNYEPFSNYIQADGYEHPLWRATRESGDKGGGHGNMDYLVLAAFFYAIENGIEPPIDTYDAATLLAVTPLSEQSCALGGTAVAIPDFTDGKWIKRGPAPKSPYSLDEVPYDMFD